MFWRKTQILWLQDIYGYGSWSKKNCLDEPFWLLHLYWKRTHCFEMPVEKILPNLPKFKTPWINLQSWGWLLVSCPKHTSYFSHQDQDRTTSKFECIPNLLENWLWFAEKPTLCPCFILLAGHTMAPANSKNFNVIPQDHYRRKKTGCWRKKIPDAPFSTQSP